MDFNEYVAHAAWSVCELVRNVFKWPGEMSFDYSGVELVQKRFQMVVESWAFKKANVRRNMRRRTGCSYVSE
jgi:hypothetical protein